MKNKLFKAFFFTLIFLSFTVNMLISVNAQEVNYKIPNPSRFESLEDIINFAASLIRPIFLLTFGALILVGAYTLLTSRGDAEKIASSRKTIIAAIVGFAIAVLAPSVVNLTTNFLGVEGFSF